MNWIPLQSQQLPYMHNNPYAMQGYTPIVSPTQYYNGPGYQAPHPHVGRSGIATPPCDEPIPLRINRRPPRKHYRNNDADTNSSGSFEHSRETVYNRLKEPEYAFGLQKENSTNPKLRRESFYRQEDALIETIKESCKITPPGTPVASAPSSIIKEVQEKLQKNIQAQVEPVTTTIGTVMKEKLEERKSALKKEVKEVKPVVVRQIDTTIRPIQPAKDKEPVQHESKVTFKDAPGQASASAQVQVQVQAQVQAQAQPSPIPLNQPTTVEISYNAILPPEEKIDHEKYNVLQENRFVVLDFVMGEQIQQIDGRLIYIPRQEVKLKVAPYIHTDDTGAFKQDVANAVIAAKS